MDLKTSEKIEIVLKQEEQRESESTISVREIIQSLIRRRMIILWIFVTLMISTFIAINVTTPNSTTTKTILSLNFEGIEKGLDPFGKRFDIENIRSINILNKVVDKLNLSKDNIKAQEIRQSISINPIIPGNVTEKIKALQEAKKENIKEAQEYAYYPSLYMIQFSPLKSLNLTNQRSREILDQVIVQYKEYFSNTYTDRYLVGNAIGSINYSEYDYPEVSLVVHNQIDFIMGYLTSKGKEKGGGSFRSKKTGMTFSDIVSSVEVVGQVDIGRMDAIIGAFNLTKDKEKLIKLYEYRIKRFELDKSKKQDESRIVNDMLSKYQKDKNLILMPGTGTTPGLGSIEMDNKDTYYDSLSERFTNTGVQSTNATHDIEYYQKEMEKFKADTIPQESKVSAMKEVDKLIGIIKTKVEKWIISTNDTVTEYYDNEVFNNALKQLSSAETYPANEKTKVIFAVGFLISLLVSVAIALFIDYWKRSGKEFTKEQLHSIKNKVSDIIETEDNK